ncbi:mRNA cleavage factor-like protein, putative [Hepatocystis sp. ex Piliocolobus tephrosceles]|nr:mRNA cleavage factor-like protein, putative [Hepatocystis sp. ex Piliocolobus tephrosceles]
MVNLTYVTNLNTNIRENKLEWLLYPQSNYEFNINEKLRNKFIMDEEKCKKRINSYMKDGIRNTVLAIMLCHRYEYPHLLLLQSVESKKYYLLSGKFKPWEKPKNVLKKKLEKYINKVSDLNFHPSKLNYEHSQYQTKQNAQQQIDDKLFEVGEYLGEWWKTHYNSVYVSYLPAHVTRPKEYIRLYQVTLSPKCIFHLPPGFILKAIPMSDLNSCGLAIGGISSILSRFKLHCMVQETEEGLYHGLLDGG